MIDIDWKPCPRKLRQFAVASLFGFPLIGLLLEKILPLVGLTAAAEAANLILVCGVIGAIVCLLGLALPRAILPVYILLVALAFPIGLTLSFLLIPLIYYGVFTPVGLGLRLLGKDPMDRTLNQGDSYWIRRKPAPQAAQYYKQY
jgi:hypothetical protein